MAYVAVRSKAAVLLLLIYCFFVAPILYGALCISNKRGGGVETCIDNLRIFHANQLCLDPHQN